MDCTVNFAFAAMRRRSCLPLLIFMACLPSLATPLQGASWQMAQRDCMHTGRADYIVPSGRLNGGFFSFLLWQKPSPGSPGDGGFDGSSMTFYDGVGPSGENVVSGTYHWPKGVQGMDRETGKVLWSGLPTGGESIAVRTAAFSNNGAAIYVTNDATESDEFPNGHPLMGFLTANGPSSYWHNGAMADPLHFGMDSPVVAPNGRIYLHNWVGRPYGANDSGASFNEAWAAGDAADCGRSDPSVYGSGSAEIVVIGSRSTGVIAFRADTGALLWTASTPGAGVDAAVTIDPSNGNCYVGAGSDDIFVYGVTKNGAPLWGGSTAKNVYAYLPGVNHAERAQGAGCLGHDGATYYFQTSSQEGDGKLYAINTADGSIKWTYHTGSAGWENSSSAPVATPNGVIVLGNNDGGVYYAIRDAGTTGVLLDTLAVAAGGNARASATVSPDGRLYLPVRTIWTAGNGDGQTPDFQTENLFTAFDLTANPSAQLWPPSNQTAFVRNHAVLLKWAEIPDPYGLFDHYAVYRSTSSFSSVAGLTPVCTVTAIDELSCLDQTALNDVSYYYAVTAVDSQGGEIKTVNSIGPRTPYNETDLQVVCIARTPRFPRYAPEYTDYAMTDPSGFGPYSFSAATGLGQGQTPETQRRPAVNDPVTYTATIRNRGTNAWTSPFSVLWLVDEQAAALQNHPGNLQPGDTASFSYTNAWDGSSHEISFFINIYDHRPGNNSMSIDTKSVAFLSYIDESRIEEFREETASYPQAQTNDFIDFLNNHMTRFNAMFAAAGSHKQVHFDVLQVLDDSALDPAIETIDFAIFPLRYRHDEGSLRLSGYYDPSEDLDYGLLHEMGHQLGLIDIYQMDVPSDWNQVSGLGYSAPDCLMRGCSHFLSSFSALAMEHWLDNAHGYYGQFVYCLPQELRLRILGADGQPLPNAVVKVYQYCERPGLGKAITSQIKAQGITDVNGEYVLPNVHLEPGVIPPAYTGDQLHDNPFGYVAVVGTNGVLHFRVEYNHGIDYAWLDITEANVAYWTGHTATAVFERQLALGGPIQLYPPQDLAELNANDWSAWAEGSDSSHTYVEDDLNRKIVGQGSVKFVTNGGFDTYLRYPRTFTAMWDLTQADNFTISFYAENPNTNFQNGSPWIRLKDADGNYFQYQYYVNGSPSDILDQANDQWQTFTIPLRPDNARDEGWVRTALGSPDLARVQYVEIHADTWGGGFTLWIDGAGFGLPSSPPVPALGLWMSLCLIGVLSCALGKTFTRRKK